MNIPASPPLRREQVDPLSGREWDRLAEAFPGASVFHGSAWARILHLTYGHRPRYLHFTRGGATEALVPLMETGGVFTGRRGVSLPFSDFCGILWGAGADSAPVLAELKGMCAEQGWSRLELREEEFRPPGAAVWREHLGHRLDLSPGADAVETGFSQRAARSVRKAARSGVAIEIRRDAAALRDYYLLHCLTRRRHRLPPQPFRFFEHLHAQLIAGGEGFVVLARHGGAAVAGAVFLKSGGAAIYKFGASDARRWSLCPNHLVMREGILALCRAGCRSLHFGRTAPGNAGLSDFKSSWGADKVSIRQFRYCPRQGGWAGGKAPAAEKSHAVFGWLPPRCNRILGSLIYPHLD